MVLRRTAWCVLRGIVGKRNTQHATRDEQQKTPRWSLGRFVRQGQVAAAVTALLSHCHTSPSQRNPPASNGAARDGVLQVRKDGDVFHDVHKNTREGPFCQTGKLSLWAKDQRRTPCKPQPHAGSCGRDSTNLSNGWCGWGSYMPLGPGRQPGSGRVFGGRGC